MIILRFDFAIKSVSLMIAGAALQLGPTLMVNVLTERLTVAEAIVLLPTTTALFFVVWTEYFMLI